MEIKYYIQFDTDKIWKGLAPYNRSSVMLGGATYQIPRFLIAEKGKKVPMEDTLNQDKINAYGGQIAFDVFEKLDKIKSTDPEAKRIFTELKFLFNQSIDNKIWNCFYIHLNKYYFQTSVDCTIPQFEMDTHGLSYEKAKKKIKKTIRKALKLLPNQNLLRIKTN